MTALTNETIVAELDRIDYNLDNLSATLQVSSKTEHGLRQFALMRLAADGKLIRETVRCLCRRVKDEMEVAGYEERLKTTTGVVVSEHSEPKQ